MTERAMLEELLSWPALALERLAETIDPLSTETFVESVGLVTEGSMNHVTAQARAL